MKTIIICDDNPIVLKGLKIQVEYCIKESVKVITFADPDKMEKYIYSKIKIDILFLDIVLENKDGILLAKRIQKNRPDIHIVFVTGYLEQAKRIFYVNPVYFLVKPINQETLKIVLENIFIEMKKEKNLYLTLETKNGICKLNLKNIYYIESQIRTLLIYMEQGNETIYMKMDDFIRLLPGSFLRTHKSFLVNMDKISHFSSEGVLLENDIRVPVSRTRYKEAKICFLKYCGDELAK